MKCDNPQGPTIYYAKPGAWEPTPRWHPYYWLGWQVRRWYCAHDHLPNVCECKKVRRNGFWWYGRPKDVAWDMLRSTYDIES